jgi:UDPglucose 6-dehydrogenase
MKIAMIGAGYVGLVSGACFADFGHSVICVDLDQSKIDALHVGKMPIFEPGLAELVRVNVAASRLSFTTSLVSAAVDADAIFIAVGTPSRRGGCCYQADSRGYQIHRAGRYGRRG